VFTIRMGVPEMEALWTDLQQRSHSGRLDRTEEQSFKRLVKTLKFLQTNPRHPGLASHAIDELTRRYGFRVWQSYLENDTPAAGRLFWTYGPGRQEITVLGIEPHPEDAKRGAYARIKLSALPPRT
jgi:hypothetical protein